ncbi:MerR HTH family regulatory protein [Microlunatus sagamiharensis]|uniref:MerR HTH family regulatory protein n=1 Tax=Microlunatus sagamiharensis TaxID=546874 RepID=A0A1H2MAP7_9ACTN|nr:MerR family transcriptional regulator [Microlunatus sagamiharensis]SDU90249.1 MerR HTH family regulatory protein [Microlunatus sagamiharensis]
MPEDPAPTDGSDPSRGVYGISVVSDLLGTGVQNLRAYERAGLLTPDRTAGGTRLYSPDDVARLRRVQRLLAEGLNLVGVGRVLDLEDNLADAHEQLDRARDPQAPTSSS